MILSLRAREGTGRRKSGTVRNQIVIGSGETREANAPAVVCSNVQNAQRIVLCKSGRSIIEWHRGQKQALEVGAAGPHAVAADMSDGFDDDRWTRRPRRPGLFMQDTFKTSSVSTLKHTSLRLQFADQWPQI